MADSLKWLNGLNWLRRLSAIGIFAALGEDVFAQRAECEDSLIGRFRDKFELQVQRIRYPSFVLDTHLAQQLFWQVIFSKIVELDPHQRNRISSFATSTEESPVLRFLGQELKGESAFQAMRVFQRTFSPNLPLAFFLTRRRVF